MSIRKKWLVVLVALMGIFASMPALAGEELAFGPRRVRIVNPNISGHVICASVTFTAPADGTVVVTASGMASFTSERQFLQLTLSRTASVRGPWLFRITPGFQLYQGYEVRMVFNVAANSTNTFYLNGRGNGLGGSISVETGSITAEFYSQANVQPQPAVAQAPADIPPDARIVNRH